MNRRDFMIGIGGASLLRAFAANAQPVDRVWRIGYVHLRAGPTERDEAFLAEMSRLGYVEGRNLAGVNRWTTGALDRLPEIVAELVRLDLDAIVVSSVQAAEAARRATRTIPIVMSGVSDPVGAGLIESLARPGVNVTGVSTTVTDLSPKRLEFLRDLLPGATRIGVLTRGVVSGDPPRVLEPLSEAAQRMKIKLIVEAAWTAADFPEAIEAVRRKGGQGLLLYRLPAFAIDARASLVGLIAKQRLPAIYELQEFVNVGGLMCYGYNVSELYRRAASYLHRIFGGAKPADLPVERPTKFELVINLKTAKALGLKIPQSILMRADRVID